MAPFRQNPVPCSQDLLESNRGSRFHHNLNNSREDMSTGLPEGEGNRGKRGFGIQHRTADKPTHLLSVPRAPAESEGELLDSRVQSVHTHCDHEMHCLDPHPMPPTCWARIAKATNLEVREKDSSEFGFKKRRQRMPVSSATQ